jgi:hypothetical protein
MERLCFSCACKSGKKMFSARALGSVISQFREKRDRVNLCVTGDLERLPLIGVAGSDWRPLRRGAICRRLRIAEGR